MAVELLMTSETEDAPPLLELPPIPLEYQPLHDDLLPPLPDDWSRAPAAAPASAPASAPAAAPSSAPAAAAALPQFDGDGVVVFDMNLRVVCTTGDDVGVALIGVGPLPNLILTLTLALALAPTLTSALTLALTLALTPTLTLILNLTLTLTRSRGGGRASQGRARQAAPTYRPG